MIQGTRLSDSDVGAGDDLDKEGKDLPSFDSSGDPRWSTINSSDALVRQIADDPNHPHHVLAQHVLYLRNRIDGNFPNNAR